MLLRSGDCDIELLPVKSSSTSITIGEENGSRCSSVEVVVTVDDFLELNELGMMVLDCFIDEYVSISPEYFDFDCMVSISEAIDGGINDATLHRGFEPNVFIAVSASRVFSAFDAISFESVKFGRLNRAILAKSKPGKPGNG